MVDRRFAEYGRGVRGLTRGLWSGSIDYSEFLDTMNDQVRVGLTRAWYAGARECGIIAPQELSLDEISALNTMINRELSFLFQYANDIVMSGRASGGKLTPLLRRAALWVNRYNDARNQAKVMACGDKKMKWIYGDTVRHCFPAGTKIDVPDGEMPIEKVSVGDKVITVSGEREVTRVYKRPHQGRMIEIKTSNGRLVLSTDNHPFLTARGWVRADDLICGDNVVINQKSLDHSGAHIAFPNPLHRVAAYAQIFVLRGIARLLRDLPVGETPEAGMTMPVITVGLDDQSADPGIDNKSWLDNTVRLVFNAIFIQYRKELLFKIRGFVPLNLRLTNGKVVISLRSLFWVISPVIHDLFNYIWSVHRVVFSHILLGSPVNAPPVLLRRQPVARWPSFSVPLSSPGYTNTFIGTHALSDPASVVDSRLKHSSANWTRNFLDRPRLVATNRGTKLKGVSFSRRWVNSPLKRLATHATEKCGRRLGSFFTGIRMPSLANHAFSVTVNGTKLSLLSIGFKLLAALSTLMRVHNHLLLDSVISTRVLYTQVCYVYNLEIEHEHHYVANGFIVHNCSSCRKLEGRVYRASTWAKYDIRPQHPSLKCGGWKCLCTLQPTDEPASRGRPPGIP